ncbi:MAG TPA: ATP-binding protein [Candidatus Binatia bacterium]|nr:ATP-binding protein [Candidatus Binatia bacterium]
MPESFPTTPRAPRAVRAAALAIALIAVALGTRTTITSTAWVGRTFPGFVLLDNRVVASIGLAPWSGTRIPGLYQSQVVAVDGRRVRGAADVYRMVAALAPGTPVSYEIAWRGQRRTVTVSAQRFGWRDWLLLFGAYLLNSAVYLASGLVVWVLRPRSALARALLAFSGLFAFYFMTAVDLYGPATFFRLHVLVEALCPAAGLHFALFFPQPHRFARFAWVGYLASLALLVPYEVVLYHPTAYSAVHNLATLYLGLDAVFFGLRLVAEYRRGRSQLARQRVRVMTLGTVFGFGLPGLLFVASAVTAGSLAVNTGAFTAFLFALSLAYAVVKHDLFEIDAMVKRGAYYLLLTGSVSAAYVAAVVVFNLILQAGDITDSPAFPVAFTLAVLVLFNPLRSRLQAFVDRVFFRTRYDSGKVLAQVGAQLAAALTREHIAALVRAGVEDAIPNTATRIFVGRDGGPHEVGGGAVVPPALRAELADGRLATAYDAPELYRDAETHEAVRAALALLDADIAVPLQHGGELVGALTAGPKRSGLFYTAGDAAFLRALAHQTATALENAASYEALVALNASLEERVRERTQQLEGANRELAQAYGELKAAETHLVQSEKMASLGRVVAGVAHEINNPVSFIAANVAPLRRRLARAAAGAAAPEVQRLLREAEEIVEVMARGAERTAAIVKDLRSFSRLGEAAHKAVDLHEGIEVSLRLLASRWRERVTIHRDYGALPPVECDAGQLNQVFMNVLANACDAIPGTGNVWITTRAEADVVTVAIRDDGAGIAPDVLGRIFEPFFTTKDVGRGTGLGLAISHGVVAAHGGRIEVSSAPGKGSTFKIVLPVAVASLDRAASASG